jgi:AcrR family transcriptional regulator
VAPTTESPTRSPGRPRDPAIDDAILDATLAVLADDGYAGLTMDRVAASAGVSKATIYRRWPTRRDVLLAAVDHLSSAVPAPDTGTLRGDLATIAHGLADVFAAPSTGPLVAALVGQAARDADLADALRTGFLAARRAAALDALRAAKARGEVCDINLEVAVDLLAAPFYYRLLVTGAPINNDLADQVVDAVMTWVSAAR